MKSKQIIIMLITIVFIFLAIAGLLMYRLRSSVKLLPDKEYTVSGELPLYRQDDPEWAEDKLGDSVYTMESSGCLVSCIASAVSGNGEQVTPGELNKLFSANAVYDGEGNLQWGKLDALDAYSVEVFNSVSLEDIQACLYAGHFPIVRVRMNGLGNFHYVLIVGSENGDFICMDPLEDNLTTLSDYAGRVYAVRCVWREE